MYCIVVMGWCGGGREVEALMTVFVCGTFEPELGGKF
jgi:hypothetical protein